MKKKIPFTQSRKQRRHINREKVTFKLHKVTQTERDVNEIIAERHREFNTNWGHI